MHIIIDGYNLLGGLGKSFRREGPFSEAARESLLGELAAYRHRKGHPLTVVFDGWQQGQPSEGREHRAGVHVVYSKRGERADQVIQRLARQYGADCAVVSSDHEIINTANAHGAIVMTVQEFAAKLHHESSSGDMVHKELDTGDDIPRRSPEKKGNPRKLPKALRRRARQLKRF
ncbi:MAG TPA: NYN domain-containing protein [Nitrospira sp.]|nr:NYN domain-containing protein [Nitrospira sp.]